MRYLILGLFILSQVVRAQESNENLTLPDCYKLARENHPYNQDRERIKTNAELKIKNINNQWLPQLNANAQATYQSEAIDITLPPPIGGINVSRDQYKTWFDVNQMIYDGGSIAAQKRMTSTSSEADSLKNESELHKVKEQVNQVYFGMLFFKENINLLESVRSTLIKRKESIEASVKNGAMQESDLDVIKIELLKNQQQIDEMKISYSSGISVLAELTGKNLSDSLQVIMPVLEEPDTVSFQRDDLKAFGYQELSLDYSSKVSQSQRAPHIYAFSQAGYGRPSPLNFLDNSFKPYYIVGLSLKWTIWDWNKTARDRQTIALQKDMLVSQKLALERNLRITLDNSKARISQFISSLATDSAIVVLRSNVTKRSSVKLEQGVYTITDYINDINAETQAKIQMESHKIQLEQEKVNYLTIKGIL